MRGRCLIKGPTLSPGTLLSQNLNVQQALECHPSLVTRIIIVSNTLHRVIFRFFNDIYVRRTFIDATKRISKMANIILTLLLISLILNAATSQTFQYSRGWTNGKRDGTAGLYNPYSADGCDGMNTFIMVAVDGKWQRTEISCEEMLKAINLSLSKKRRSVPTEFPFHRRPVATSDDNNNNNY